MKRVAVTTGFVLLLASTKSHAQSEAVAPPVDAAPASQTSCVILKRIGRIGRTESRLTHFGISGKQFSFVEGKLPDGFSFRERMNENNVRNLQARGTQVLVLDPQYTADDLKEARADCQRGSGKAASQVEAKASPPPAPAVVASSTAPTAKPPASTTGAIASTPAPPTKLPATKGPPSKAEDSGASAGTTVAALLDVSSTPAEADVYVDDRLSGRTPSTLILMPGDHMIAIKKNGFVVFQRKLKLASGRVNLDADLVPKAK